MVKADVKYDYYADLDLPRTADAEEIKKQFRNLAKQYHPDRNPGREVEVVAKFQAVQAAHEILSDPQQKAKYDADRAKQEKAARDVLNAFRRNANPVTKTANFPPPRYATTGARGGQFNTSAGRGRPPPPPTQPSFGADKYAAFTRAGAQQRDRAEEEAQKAKYDAMRGFRSMRNGQSQAFPTAPPPQPPRPSGHPTAPHPDINTPSAGVPPRHQRSYEHFQNMPQPGFPGMSRTASARKPAGFAPSTPGGDEPMAQRTSAYAHHHSSQRRDSYFPEDNTPHSPAMARPEPATSPLKKSQSHTDLDDASRRPQRPELNRLSTRYANSGGEKTYVNGVGRSASVRNSPVEREWGVHEDHGLRRPHSHHEPSARHQSASPHLRPTPYAKELSSSDSESSTDGESENFASRPKAKLRPRRQKAGTGAFNFRHVAADDPGLNSQFPPPNHKHAHSPQDEYTARYEYPPPLPRSDPRAFPEPQPFQNSGNPRMDDIRQHTRHVSSGTSRTNPNMYGTFHSPSRTWSEDWGFSPSKLIKAGPSLNGLPSWAVPSSVFPQQKSSAQKEPLETIAEENVGKAKDWLSHANPRFNQKLFSKADHVSRTSFTGVDESSSRPYPQPGHQSVSHEDINKTFSAADWDGKFNSGDEHFRPTEAREGKSPSRTSRTRARSVGRGRMMSPNKDEARSEPIDLTSDGDAPKASDVHDQNGRDQTSKPTAQAFQPAKFSAEEWAAKLRDQTWAIPSSELNGNNPKTPKRPSKSTSARRPTTSTKVDSDAATSDKPIIPPKFVSETAVTGLSDFGATTNGGRRASGGAAADAMDIDDTFSDAVPLTPPTNNELPDLDQPAPRNKFRTPSDVNLNNFAKVAPFAPSSTGLRDMDDLFTNLPFESRAAPAVDLSKPVSGSSSDLRLPKPPKPIIPPSDITQLSWARYVADMNAYVCDWNVFNKKMIEHFSSRQEQVEMSMSSRWISMNGDGRSPDALDGPKAGYATYMAWLEEDDRCREWWNVANERNRQCFEHLGKMRVKVKAAAAEL